jgi:thiamine biosynthesis protein ThiI
MSILVHYGELALKGKNRRLFENKLIENIKKATGGKVRRFEGRLLVEDGHTASLKNVFGISWFASSYRARKELNAIRELIIEKASEMIKGRPTFGIFVKRVDKKFPYTSMEVAKDIGEAIVRKYKLDVSLKNPELPIYIEIADEVFVHFEKVEGLGGLPVGVSGRVLGLLSGGIDSPVASYLIMKRGCNVDFIHFHVFADNGAVHKTKIADLVSILNKYQFGTRVFLAPYKLFQVALMKNRVGPGYELILFRRFMARVAERVAKKWGLQALVTGDSLGQVASQTIENLNLAGNAVSLPVLQPLISFDKEEIVRLARQIGTYDVSIRPYKDCCSIIAPNPKIKTRLSHVETYEQRIDIDRVINETLELIEVCEW